MEVKAILDKTHEQMQKSIDFCISQISKVRSGRATVSLVDIVLAEYYGTPTPISQMANISVPDPRSIVIQPWDRTTIGNIEKAIRQADLGFNPQSDGTVIRIPVPPLTEQRRKEYVKLAKKYSEEGKISIRNIRRDQMEALKKAEKNKDISEDDRKRGEDEIQKITDELIKNIDKVFAQKEKELMDN